MSSHDALRYRVDGDRGRTVLMVPGLSATAAFLAPTAAALARDHRVVVVPLPGHGVPLAGPATVKQAAEDVAAVVRELSLRQVTLLGWSLGATVCYEYLDRFGPDGVTGLVSVEQTPRLTLAPDWPHAAFGGLDEAAVPQLVRSALDDPAAFAADLVGGSFAYGAEPDPLLLASLVAEAQRCDPVAVGGLLADALGQDRRERMGRITVPTLLVHGAGSQVYPTPVGQWLATAMPAARLELFEHSGHLPFVEEEPKFTTAVRDFVAATGRSTDRD